MLRVAGSGVQDSRSMKFRFSKPNLLLTHVLDSCVKILAVSHISSAQRQSVDLSLEITTRRRRMTNIILTLGPLPVALYGV